MSRLGRILDGVAATIFVAGAGLYLWAWNAIRRTEQAPRPEEGATFAAVDRVAALDGWSRVGLAAMAVGGAVGVAAAVVARRRSGRRSKSRVREDDDIGGIPEEV